MESREFSHVGKPLETSWGLFIGESKKLLRLKSYIETYYKLYLVFSWMDEFPIFAKTSSKHKLWIYAFHAIKLQTLFKKKYNQYQTCCRDKSWWWQSEINVRTT